MNRIDNVTSRSSETHMCSNIDVYLWVSIFSVICALHCIFYLMFLGFVFVRASALALSPPECQPPPPPFDNTH